MQSIPTGKLLFWLYSRCTSHLSFPEGGSEWNGYKMKSEQAFWSGQKLVEWQNIGEGR